VARARSAAFLLLLLAATAACAQPIVLRYGQSLSAQRSIFSLPVTVAEREGLFRREGLDFRVVIPQPGGADLMIAALHDDTVDVTHVATPFLVRAALGGCLVRSVVSRPNAQPMIFPRSCYEHPVAVAARTLRSRQE